MERLSRTLILYELKDAEIGRVLEQRELKDHDDANSPHERSPCSTRIPGHSPGKGCGDQPKERYVDRGLNRRQVSEERRSGNTNQVASREIPEENRRNVSPDAWRNVPRLRRAKLVAANGPRAQELRGPD